MPAGGDALSVFLLPMQSNSKNVEFAHAFIPARRSWFKVVLELLKMVANKCNYDKTRLIVDIGRMINFIESHAVEDANGDDHPLCAVVYQELRADLEKHQAKLKEAVAGLSREGKYY